MNMKDNGKISGCLVREGSLPGTIIALLLVFSSIFMLGCTDPNDNLTIGSCCLQSDEIYDESNSCIMGSKIIDANDAHYGMSPLEGDCEISGKDVKCAWVDSTGTIYGIDGKALDVRPNQCGRSCNFQKADCTNAKDASGKVNNTCYGYDEDGNLDNSIRIAPICLDATPDPCIKNECKAMMYGKVEPGVKLEMDEKGLVAVTKADENLFSQTAEALQGGLVGKIAQAKKIDNKTSRLLKSGDWTINSFRLGISGTFSDYARARYYFPPSDAFCTNSGTGAVVDRYMNYIGGGVEVMKPGSCTCDRELGQCDNYGTDEYMCHCTCNADNMQFEYGPYNSMEGMNNAEMELKQLACIEYCAPLQFSTGEIKGNVLSDFIMPDGSIDYKAPVAYCQLDEYAQDNYYCKNNEDLIFYFDKNSQDSKDIAYQACKKACTFSSRTCSENSQLITTELDVSSPLVADKEKEYQQFIDKDTYIKSLKEAYNSPDALNYYRESTDLDDVAAQLAQISSMSDEEKEKAMENAMAELSKPGPAGGKVFECESDADCMSSNCDKSSYSRSSCFLKDGTPVDCGCIIISSCREQYQQKCSSYVEGSMQRAKCDADWNACDWKEDSTDLKVLCKYDYESEKFTRDVYVDTYPFGTLEDNKDTTLLTTPGGEVRKFSAFEDNYLKDGTDNIELANQQVYTYMQEPMCINKDANGGRGDMKWAKYKCPDGYKLYDNGCAKDADGDGKYDTFSEREYIDCISSYGAGYEMAEDLSVWKDDAQSYSPSPKDVYTKWNWNSYITVPTMQKVASSQWGPLSIYTHRDRTWDDLKKIMPLISACNMKGAKSTEYDSLAQAMADPNVDVIEIIPVVTSGLEIGSNGYRFEKTWQIKSFGDCQMGDNNVLTVRSYGVCESCGTVLSMAYQKVEDATSGYCPSGCKIGYADAMKNIACTKCSNSYPELTFAYNQIGSPSTEPEFGFLASKIDEYQSSDIIPVLDLKDYSRGGAGMENFAATQANGGTIMLEFEDTDKQSLKYKKCISLGGVPGKVISLPTLHRFADRYALECMLAPIPDYLLSFLQKNHSIAVLIIDELPSKDTCAESNEPQKCEAIYNRIQNAKTICPDCIYALEYEEVIRPMQTSCGTGAKQLALNEELIYNASLKEAIYNWAQDSKATFPDPPERGEPKWVAPVRTPPRVEDVDVLVLKVDLSQIKNEDDFDKVISQMINFSSHTLQQVGWPTIWKLEYDETCAGMQGFDSYAIKNKENLFEKLWQKQREMSLAGIWSVLLPPMDNADPEQIDMQGENAMRLIPQGYNIDSENTPFCAVQESTKTFLSPTITASVRKIYAKEQCDCQACSSLEVAMGLCTADSMACLDGTLCQKPDGQIQPGWKCPSNCITKDFCAAHVCGQMNKEVTCLAVRSENKELVACKAGEQYPDLKKCDVATLNINSFADELLQPDAPLLIGGLGGPDKCCIKSIDSINPAEEVYYTYETRAAITYEPESMVYPAFGANTTDCGKALNVEDSSISVCGGASLYPSPLSNTYWSCTAAEICIDGEKECTGETEYRECSGNRWRYADCGSGLECSKGMCVTKT